jgi:hypothetical protein
MSLASRLQKLERALHLAPGEVRLIWVMCRVKIGANADHESYWSCLDFEGKHGTLSRQGVSIELINSWQRAGDTVIVISDPTHCADYLDLPFGTWPDVEGYIDRDQLIEWRDYQRGSTWSAYAAYHRIEVEQQNKLEGVTT